MIMEFQLERQSLFIALKMADIKAFSTFTISRVYGDQHKELEDVVVYDDVLATHCLTDLSAMVCWAVWIVHEGEIAEPSTAGKIRSRHSQLAFGRSVKLMALVFVWFERGRGAR